MSTTTRRVLALGFATALAVGVSGCVQDSSTSSGGSGGDSDGGGSAKSGKIALLLPESKTTRYESFDRPFFEAKVKELCADCEVVYANADQDAAKQQQQAESMITQGVKVMVLDPVDGDSAKTIVNNAKGQQIPVISYDRFIKGAPIDYYVSFDNEKVGQLQGQTLVDGLKKAGKTSGEIVVINGSPTDNNATLFKKGAHSVLDTSGFTLLPDFDTPDWSPDKAQAYMDGQLSKVDKSKLVAVYAANDGTAGGAISAMKAAGVNPLPLVTGQDAELPAIQRVLAGDQYMTVYKAIKPEAEKAAELAVALLRGEKPTADSEVEGIPSVLLEPIAVTKDNVKDTVIKDGFYKAADVCTSTYAAACKAAGIQ